MVLFYVSERLAEIYLGDCLIISMAVLILLVKDWQPKRVLLRWAKLFQKSSSLRSIPYYAFFRFFVVEVFTSLFPSNAC